MPKGVVAWAVNNVAVAFCEADGIDVAEGWRRYIFLTGTPFFRASGRPARKLTDSRLR
jgi:hypothetical protein